MRFTCAACQRNLPSGRLQKINGKGKFCQECAGSRDYPKEAEKQRRRRRMVA